MRQWSMSSSSRGLLCLLSVLLLATPAGWTAVAAPVTTERDPVTMRVVIVNPSAEKPQSMPVKIELPQEVTPEDVLNRGDLTLEYDDQRSMYYLYKESVELKPHETRVFEVSVRDIWWIPQSELNALDNYTDLIVGRLAKSDYHASAKELGDSIHKRLEEIVTTQEDETLSRKQRIGMYRHHLQALAEVKEDLARMEKLLTFAGGPPVPVMMEEAPVKSDAPSTTTTWLVIFAVLIFLGLLAGQFFFTWHSRARAAQDLSNVQQLAFPSATPSPAGPTATNGDGTPAVAAPPRAAPAKAESPAPSRLP
ncbi:MAG: hypothetical protein HY597_03175 [Candidatus Omnitrophica bacterium]|nr:hypothetical protein [Candidatus Omnitrophota bacterium]